MSTRTLFGMPLLETCPCGTLVTHSERQDVVFDAQNEVWHLVCENCLRGDSSKQPN